MSGTSSNTPSSKQKSQGTLKTRYFLVYLERMRVKLFCDARQPPLDVCVRQQHSTAIGEISWLEPWETIDQTSGGGARRDGRRNVKVPGSKQKSQGTLKTRYFLVYLACMCVKRFLGRTLCWYVSNNMPSQLAGDESWSEPMEFVKCRLKRWLGQGERYLLSQVQSKNLKVH